MHAASPPSACSAAKNAVYAQGCGSWCCSPTWTQQQCISVSQAISAVQTGYVLGRHIASTYRYHRVTLNLVLLVLLLCCSCACAILESAIGCLEQGTLPLLTGKAGWTLFGSRRARPARCFLFPTFSRRHKFTFPVSFTVPPQHKWFRYKMVWLDFPTAKSSPTHREREHSKLRQYWTTLSAYRHFATCILSRSL